MHQSTSAVISRWLITHHTQISIIYLPPPASAQARETALVKTLLTKGAMEVCRGLGIQA